MDETARTSSSIAVKSSPPVGAEIAPPEYGPSLLKRARRVVVFALGISVLTVGIVMIVAPGPAIVVIPLGLGILATEFLWARRALDTLKKGLADAHSATAQANLPRWMRLLLTVGRAQSSPGHNDKQT